MEDKKPSPFKDLLLNIVIPSVILMKFSGPEDLGALNALLIALAFPLVWGGYELIRFKKFNFFSLLGFISVLLTGGIGLFELDNKWLAIKEAAVPGIIGLVVMVSSYTPYPIVKKLIFNNLIFKLDTIYTALSHQNRQEEFERRLRLLNNLLAGSFFFSSVMNYILAKMIVTSPSGTSEFNEELGQLTLISYPAIAIPSFIMMIGVFYFLWRSIKSMTQLEAEQIIRAE